MNLITELNRRAELLEKASHEWPEDTKQYAALSRASNELMLFREWIQAHPKPSVIFLPRNEMLEISDL